MKRRRNVIPLIVVVIFLVIAFVVIATRGCQPEDGLDTPAASTTPASAVPSSPAPLTTSHPPATTATQATTTTVPQSLSPTTATVSPTKTTNPFQGLVIGNWAGQIRETQMAAAGIFKVMVGNDGVVSGSFEGDYSGSITGKVDLSGNLMATGTASGGTSVGVTSWEGQLSVSGSALVVQGDISSSSIGGTFSGKGNSVAGNMPASTFRGSLNCTWSGQRANGTPLSGTFNFNIDTNGDIQGSLEGSVPAGIVGYVDQSGNMVAIGRSSGGTTTLGSTFSALVAVSGNNLNVNGTWSSREASGTFSGSGIVSR